MGNQNGRLRAIERQIADGTAVAAGGGGSQKVKIAVRILISQFSGQSAASMHERAPRRVRNRRIDGRAGAVYTDTVGAQWARSKDQRLSTNT